MVCFIGCSRGLMNRVWQHSDQFDKCQSQMSEKSKWPVAAAGRMRACVHPIKDRQTLPPDYISTNIDFSPDTNISYRACKKPGLVNVIIYDTPCIPNRIFPNHLKVWSLDMKGNLIVNLQSANFKQMLIFKIITYPVQTDPRPQSR